MLVGHEDSAQLVVIGQRPLGRLGVDEGAVHQAPVLLIHVRRCATVQHGVIVPDDQLARLPAMPVHAFGPGGQFDRFLG